jgi:RNA polymerase sigma-70 factor (ECF subfamily)
VRAVLTRDARTSVAANRSHRAPTWRSGAVPRILRPVAEAMGARHSPELTEAIGRARAVWPQLEVDDEELGAWLLERSDPATPLSRLHVADLLLACACARGRPEAIAAFHAAFDAGIAATLARASQLGSDADDLRQLVDVHLFVAEGGAIPRIADYRGIGSLRTWVRVVATRLLINSGRRKNARHDPLTSRVERELDDGGDLELDWLKERYRSAFRAALTESLAELAPSDRSLLRLCVVGGLSATGVASIYNVHRATAKRWIARVRRDVLEATRARILASLRVDALELDSIMGLIGSRLEASVRRCLADDEVGDAG